jgi:hypothetical protein
VDVLPLLSVSIQRYRRSIALGESQRLVQALLQEIAGRQSGQRIIAG